MIITSMHYVVCACLKLSSKHWVAPVETGHDIAMMLS